MLRIICFPLLFPLWGIQLLLWVCFLPLSIVMKLCGAEVSLLPPFPFFKNGSNSTSNQPAPKPAPVRPETSAEYAKRNGFGNGR